MKYISALTAILFLVSGTMVKAEYPVIDGGTHVLIGDTTTGQEIIILISDSDENDVDIVSGWQPAIQIGDGTSGPLVTYAEGDTGTIFEGATFSEVFPDTPNSVENGDQDDSGFVTGNVAFLPGSGVAADGTILTLTITTDGITSGRFGIIFEDITLPNDNVASTILFDNTGTAIYDPANNITLATINSGQIVIGDNPLVIWSGDQDDSFSDFRNWLHMAAPEAGDTIQFSGTSNTVVDMDQTANTAYHGITFDSTAQGFVLDGNAIGIDAGQAITNNSALVGSHDFGDGAENFGQALLVDIKATGDMTFDAAAGDLLFADSNISMTGSSTLTVDGGAGTTVDVLSNILGSSAIVDVQTAGNLILAGTNTFMTLNINSGVVEFENGNAMSNTGLVNIADGATLLMDSDNEQIGTINAAAGSTINLGTSILVVGGTGNSTFSGVIIDTAAPDDNNEPGDAGGIVLLTDGTVSFQTNETNTYSLATVIGNNANALDQQNTLWDTTVDKAPTVVYNNNNAFGDGVIVFNKGALDNSAAGGTNTIANDMQIGGDVSFVGKVDLAGTVSLDASADDNDDRYGSDVTSTSRTITVVNETDIVDIRGILDADSDLIKAGAGLLELTGDNNSNSGVFRGDITINGGSVNVTNDSSAAGDIIINNGEFIANSVAGLAVNTDSSVNLASSNATFTVSQSQQVGQLVGVANSSVVVADGQMLTLGAEAIAIADPTQQEIADHLAQSTYAGNISGLGGLNINADVQDDINETPPGIVVFSGANTYTGDTSVNSGALLLTDTGSITSDVTIENTGILGGQGTVTGDVLVKSGGELTAANSTDPYDDSADTFNVVGDVNVQAGGMLFANIGILADVAVSDLINITGTLTFADQAIIDLSQIENSGMEAGEEFTIASTTGGVTDNGVQIEEDIAGYSFEVAIVNGNLVLTSLEQVEAKWIAGTGDFSVEANWDNDPDGVQSDVQDLILVFEGTGTNQTYTVDADESPYSAVGGIRFQGTNTFVITDNTATLAFTNTTDAAIVNETTNLQTIEARIESGSTVDLTIDAESGDLRFDGAVVNNNQLSLAGDNDIDFYGVISGAGGIVKADAGTTTLRNTNTYTGDTILNAGVLDIEMSASIDSNVTINDGAVLRIHDNTTIDTANSITMTDGATLDAIDSASAINNDMTLSGIVNFTSSALDINGGTNGTVTLAGDTTINNPLALDITANLVGTNSLTKTGDGDLTLSGSNDGNSVDLTISDGQLILSGGAAVGDSALLTVSTDGGSNVGSVALNNSETLGSIAGNGGINLNANTLTLGGSQTSVYSGVLSGIGQLEHAGAGQLTLSGDNTYTGSTTISNGTVAITGSVAGGVNVNGGTFIIGADDALADGQTLTVTSGNLQSDDDARSLSGGVPISVDGDFAVTGANDLTLGGTVNLNGGSRTITTTEINNTTTLNGVISNGSLAKSGLGQLNLTATNTFADGFTLNAGTVGIGNDAALGTGDLTINGGTIHALGDGNVANDVVVNSNFTIDGADDTVDAILSGAIDLSGGDANHLITIDNPGTTSFSGDMTGGDFTKSGSGQLTLTGTNNFVNGVTVNEGTLRFNHSNAISADDDLTVTGTGSVQINDDITLDALIGTGTGTVAIGAGNLLTVNSGGVDIVISGDTGRISKTTAGTLVLNGANTYGGGTNIMAGTLKAGNNAALGTGNINLFGGTLEAGAANLVIGNDILLGADSTILTNDQDMTLTGDLLASAMVLNKSGAQTLTLQGNSAMTGQINVLAGTLAVENGDAVNDAQTVNLSTANSNLTLIDSETVGSLTGSGTVTLGSNTLTVVDSFGDSFTGVMSGTGGFTLNNPGQNYILEGANTYTGDTTITAGALFLTGDNIADTSDVIVNGTLNVGGDETVGDLSGSGNINNGGNSFTFGVDEDTTLSGTISGAGDVTYQGSGVFTHSGNSTYTGATNINGGTFNVSGSLDSTALTIINGATLQLSRAGGSSLVDDANIEVTNGTFDVDTNQKIADLDQAADGVTELAADLTIEGDGASTSNIAGSITGTGDLNIDGDTTAILTGTNSSTGSTNVSGNNENEVASYSIQGTSSAGTLNINSFGEVDLTGTAGDINVNNNGTLRTTQGATDVATINGDLIVSDGGTLDVDISNNNGTLTNDVYNVSGDVNLMSNSIVAITDIGPSAVVLGNAFEFVTYTGTNDGAANMDQVRLQESLSDVAFSLSDSGSGLSLTAIEVQDIVWDGEGNDGLFSTTTNWDDDVNGVTFNTDTAGAYDLEGFGLTFSGVSNNGGSIVADNGGNGTINSYINIASIQFLDTAEDMTISGLDLNFINDQTTDIINNSSNNHNIDNNIVTGNTSMTISASSGDLFFEGTVQNNGGITVTGTNDTYLNDVVSGSGSLSKTGSGTLELNAANTYTGGSTIAAGRVVISDEASFGTGDVNFNGGTLESNGVANIANTFTIGGNVAFDGSDMNLTGGVSLGEGQSSRTVTVDGGTNVTISSILSGSNTMVKRGDGGLTLSGANTYTGDVYVNDGNLTLSGGTALGDTALLTVNDDEDTNTGSVTVTDDETIGALAGSGDVDIDDNTLTLTGSQTATHSGVISGVGGSVTYTGSGVQTLAGDNTYTGSTTVDGTGTLSITGSVDGDVLLEEGNGTLLLGDDAIDSASNLNILGGNLGAAEADATINSSTTLNGDLTFVGTNDLSLDGTINLGAGTRTINVTDTGALTLDGIVSGTGGLTIDGTGTVVLGDDTGVDANTYTGDTTLTAGTLIVANDNALGNTGDLILNGGTLGSDDSERSIGNDVIVNADTTFTGEDLVLSGNVDLSGGDADHLLTANNDTALTGNVTGGDITVDGNGSLSLSGDNDFVTGVTVTGDGLLQISSVDALADNDSLTINGGTADINAATTVSDLSGTGGTLRLNADLTFGDDTSNTLASNIIGASDLIFNGTGTQTISGDNAGFSGDTTLNSGTTVAASNTAFGTGTIIANGGTLRSGETAVSLDNDISLNADTTFRGGSQMTLNGDITGNNTFTKDNANTVILTGESDFDTLAILGGEVILNHTGGGTLAADTGLTIANAGSTLTLGVDQTFGFVNTNADTQVNLGANTLTIDYDGGSNEMAGVITGTGGLVKEGVAELTLSGTNTYTGDTIINDGILSLAGGNAIVDSGDVIVNAGGTLNLDADETIGSLAGSGNVNLDTHTLGLGGSVDTSYSGVISGTGDVDFDGSGTWTVSGENTFTGDININSGTIHLDDTTAGVNNIFSGDVNINGGTLTGNGYLGGTLNLNSGTLSIGNSTGTIHVDGDFNAAADGNMIFELTGGMPDTAESDVDGSDVLSVDGNVVLANGITLTLVLNDDDDLAEEGDYYDIILAGGTLTAGDLTLIDAALIQTHYEVIDGDTLRVFLDNLLDFGEATTGSVNPLIGQALVQVAAAADGGNAKAQALVDALGDLDQDGLIQYVKELNDGIDVSVLASRNIFQLIQTFSQVLSNHLTARRSGMPVFAQQGDTTMLAGLTDDPHTLAQVAAQQDEAAPRTVPMQEWAAFGKLYGLFSDQETTSGRTGFSSDAVGIQLGMDYQVNENLIVGLSLDYTSTDVTFDSGYGDMDTDSFRVGPFASYFTDKWFIDASLTFGVHSSESTRNDTSTGSHDGDFDATDITLYLGGGYDFKLSEAWTLTPTASLRYTYYNRDAYTETGTGGIAYEEYDVNTLHSRLGVRLAYQLNTMNMLMIPELMLGWEHEYLGEGDTINGTFSGVGAFNVNTGNPDEDSVFFGAGLTAIVDEQWTTFIRYEGNVSADGETHGISGGLRYEF